MTDGRLANKIGTIKSKSVWKRNDGVVEKGLCVWVRSCQERNRKGVSEHALFGLTLDAGLAFLHLAHKHTQQQWPPTTLQGIERTWLGRKSERERLCLGLSSLASYSLLDCHWETKIEQGFVFQSAKDYSWGNSLAPHKICFSWKAAFLLSWELCFCAANLQFQKMVLEVDIPVKKSSAVVQCVTVPEELAPGKTKVELVKG